MPLADAAPSEHRPYRRDVGHRRRRTSSDENCSSTMRKTVCPTCGSCAGMFTANSMNCLTEAIGLALPGNGTILASHSYRKDLFERAAARRSSRSPTSTMTIPTIPCCRAPSPPREALRERYDHGCGPWAAPPTPCCTSSPWPNPPTWTSPWTTSSVFPYTIVPLHLKASPSGSGRFPTCTAPAASRGILGELDRAGKLHTNVHSIDYPTLEAKLADWDIMRPTCTEEAQQMYKGRSWPHHLWTVDPHHPVPICSTVTAPTAPSTTSTTRRFTEGGLAVLRGNLAPTAAWVGPPVFRRRSEVPWTALVVDSQRPAYRF